MGIAELGFFDGIDDVAKQRDGAAQADGVAGKPRDDRFLQIKQAIDQPLALPDRDRERGGISMHVIEPLQVATGAEGIPLAREYHHIDIAVGVDVIENTREFFVQHRINGVQSSGP